MKIYFDNELINENYYKSLKNDHNLFNSSFALGSTASNTFTLELDKNAVSNINPNIVKITENDEDFATLVVDNVEEVDKDTLKYTLTDKLVDLNYYYDASELIAQKGGSAKMSEILADMCSKIGLEVDKNINWIDDIDVTWYDNTILARDYAGFIAENNAGYIFILPNGKLTIRQHNMASKYDINIEDCEDVTIGEKHVITKVVYDNGTVKYEAGDDTGNTLYINSENVFIINQEQINKIYNSVKGFAFYSVSTKNCPINEEIKAGDVITFIDGENKYPTIATIDLEYNVGWFGGYSLEINTERQDETELIGNNNKIKSIVSRLNRDEATLEVISKQTDEHEEQIGKLEVGFNEISQEVSQITVPIQEVNGNGNITLENTSNTDLYTFSIKGNISLLFGNDGKQYGEPVFFSDNLYFNDNQVFSTGVPLAEILYPSSTLFGKNMNLIIEYEDETQVIKLPFTYLNYISQDVCDEFILQDGKASVIRRVGINSNMKKYQLENEVIEDLGEFAITLKEGNPKIYLQCFDNAIYNASYMIKNEYTDIFATKVELSSSIEQTNKTITAEVNGKIDTLDKELNAKIELKVNTTDLISEINASADIIRLTGNRIIIDSELFKLSEDGKVEMLDASVNGVFRQYDNSTGYLAMELNENQVKLYDWKSNLGRMGDISSVYLDDNKSKGIALIGDQDYIAIAFRTSETTSENIMTFYKNSLSTPYVKNTASGTLFPNAGGIEVENGFIKNWNMQGVSGELYVADPGNGSKVTVYVNNGLITGWDV